MASLRLAMLALVLLALGTTLGHEAQPYVANAGGCDAVASPSNAQARIDAAGAGDVVCLEAGVFRGRLSSTARAA